MGELTQLDAVEEVLRLESRPMSSREIATLVQQTTEVSLTGSTPWKTVNARLSEDIRTRGDFSKFLRTGQGQFGLREWEGVKEFHSFKRKLKPLDEVIRVIPRDLLSTHKLTEVHTGVFDIDIRSVLLDSIEMVRLEAEEVVEVTQLVPTFLVRLGDELLCYTRTKRLPEARLHHRRSISFGGHMQSDDVPTLFFHDNAVLSQFLNRELYEELELKPLPSSIEFRGMIHLSGNDFELQHAGLVFEVVLNKETEIRSLEPGMHTDMAFEKLVDLSAKKDELDTWSRTFLELLEDHN